MWQCLKMQMRMLTQTSQPTREPTQELALDIKIHRELRPSSASHFGSSKFAKSKLILRHFEVVTQQSPKSVLFRSPKSAVDAQPVGCCVLLCPPQDTRPQILEEGRPGSLRLYLLWCHDL